MGPEWTAAAALRDAIDGTGLLTARLGVRVPGRGAGPRRSRRTLRSAARSVWHRVLAHVQGTRRLPHADALGHERPRRFLQRRAVAARSRETSRALGGHTGARSDLRAAWLPSPARMAPPPPAVDPRRYRVPR